MPLPGTSGRHRVYLMRHGAVAYFDGGGKPVNPKLVTLTEEGRAQAEAAAAALSGVAFDRILCSGVPRSRETAEIVRGARSLPVEEYPAFREIRAGRLDGVPPDRREAELVYGFETAALPGARFAGGDSFAGFHDRVVGAFEAVLAEPGWTRLLLVSHDGVNRSLLSWASGGNLAGFGAFEQDMACINIVDVDLAGGEILRRLVKAVNLTPYDPAKSRLHLTSLEQILGPYAGLSPIPRRTGETP